MTEAEKQAQISQGTRRVLHGTTRVVFLTRRYALKFPTYIEWRLFLHGLLANMQEARWSGISDQLCPVVWSAFGGFLVVMRRAEPLTLDEFFSITDDWFYDDKAECVLPVENKQCSFGILDGKVVAVDYGN